VPAELGAEDDYELVSYNPYAASDAERQWYVDAVHPHGTVPALVDDVRGGSAMLESAAICMYLADRHRRLLPQPDAMSDYLEYINTFIHHDGIVHTGYYRARLKREKNTNTSII